MFEPVRPPDPLGRYTAEPVFDVGECNRAWQRQAEADEVYGDGPISAFRFGGYVSLYATPQPPPFLARLTNLGPDNYSARMSWEGPVDNGGSAGDSVPALTGSWQSDATYAGFKSVSNPIFTTVGWSSDYLTPVYTNDVPLVADQDNPVVETDVTIAAAAANAAAAALLTTPLTYADPAGRAADVAARTSYTDGTPASIAAAQAAGAAAYALLAAGDATVAAAAAAWAVAFPLAFTPILDDDGKTIWYRGQGRVVLLEPSTAVPGGPWEFVFLNGPRYLFFSNSVGSTPAVGSEVVAWGWSGVMKSSGLVTFTADGDGALVIDVTMPAVTASGVSYTPGNGADWVDPDPTTVQQALDRIAAYLAFAVGGPIP